MAQSGSLPSSIDILRDRNSIGGNVGEGDVRSSDLVGVGLANLSAREAQQRREFLQRQARGIENECADCKEPISAARREANAFATRCCACQQEQEELQ